MVRRAATVAAVLVLAAAAFLLGDQRTAAPSRNARPSPTASPVRTLHVSGQNCGRAAVQAKVSGDRFPMPLLACTGRARLVHPQVLQVKAGQTISIIGLDVTDRNGRLLTDSPTMVLVDNGQRQLITLAAGHARIRIRSRLICPLAGNLCTLLILNIS